MQSYVLGNSNVVLGWMRSNAYQLLLNIGEEKTNLFYIYAIANDNFTSFTPEQNLTGLRPAFQLNVA